MSLIDPNAPIGLLEFGLSIGPLLGQWLSATLARSRKQQQDESELTVQHYLEWLRRQDYQELADRLSTSASLLQSVGAVIAQLSAKTDQQAQDLANRLASNELKLDQILERLQGDSTRLRTLPNREEIVEAFQMSSHYLLSWPTTLDGTVWIDRRELSIIADNLRSASEPIVVLGEPGCGKSALLAKLAEGLRLDGIPVLGIKADLLAANVDSYESLAKHLQLPFDVVDALRELASESTVVVILDQLDALADLIDLHSGRLNILLHLVAKASKLPNVRIVCSSRTFDYNHDVRLSSLAAQRIELQPPEWSAVSGVLERRGIATDGWPDDLKELLRSPQHLKVFLNSLRGPEELAIISSRHQLLEQLWRRSILKQSETSPCELLVDRLAEQMSNEEVLWVPAAQFDGDLSIIDRLIADGILVRTVDLSRIGFAHQTLFEHARARLFAKRHASLADYVLARQDSVFVRPTLWTSLRYLRGADIYNYEIELNSLWHRIERTHLRYLLIEFLAQQDAPTDLEARLLLEKLLDNPHRAKILRSVAGQRTWFDRLKTSHLPVLMSDTSTAPFVAGILSAASRFAREETLALFEKYWLPNAKHDDVSFRVLRDLETWDESTVQYVCTINNRTHIVEWAVLALAEAISADKPELAPRVIGAAFRAEMARQKSAREQPGHFESRGHDFLAQQGWYSLPEIAASAPREYLSEIWPLFLEVVRESYLEPNRYYDEYVSDRSRVVDSLMDEEPSRHPIIDSIVEAVRSLARHHAEAFLDFYRDNQDSESMAVQCLLALGIAEIAPRHPEAALGFVLDDLRRLRLGTVWDDHEITARLFTAICPSLDESQLTRLEDAVHSFSQYKPEALNDEPSTRKMRLDHDRESRLRLLRLLPYHRLTARTRSKLDAEEVALGAEVVPREKGEIRLIDSPMSPDQMRKAKKKDIVRLLQGLPDHSDSDHPHRPMHGGSIQASQAFAEYARQHPEEAVAVIRDLEPLKNERPVGYAIRELARSEFPSTELLDLIVELDSRGFASQEFRDGASHALADLAGKSDGLGGIMERLLERWLQESQGAEEQDEEYEDGQGSSHDQPVSVLWNRLGGYTLPRGNYWVLEALTYSYLRNRPPKTDEWLCMLDEHVGRPERSRTWIVFVEELRYLRMCDGERSAQFLRKLFQKYPKARDSALGGRLLARLREFLPKPFLRESLEAVRTSDWKDGAQTYGEILGLCALTGRKAPWAKEQVASLISNAESSRHDYRDILTGLAFAAINLWEEAERRDETTDLLLRLIPLSDEHLGAAIMDVFRVADALYHDDATRRLLTGIAENPQLLALSADNYLVEKLEPLLPDERDVVYCICDNIVKVHGKDVIDIRTAFSLSEANLVNIAITLQRLGGEYRAKGLDLFEKLLVLGANEAQGALNELDRRFPSPERPVARRRRTRRRNSPNRKAT